MSKDFLTSSERVDRSMGHAFVSPLNWGLGHASRDIPVIEELLRNGHDVTIGACGNAYAFLKREFPSCNFIYFEDYPQPYNSGIMFLTTFTKQMPALVRAFEDERREFRRILSRRTFDLIVSDSRPGVYSDSVPSVQFTHQVHQSLPLLVWPLELFGVHINANAFKKYTNIVVPDNPPGEGRSVANYRRHFSNLHAKNSTIRVSLQVSAERHADEGYRLPYRNIGNGTPADQVGKTHPA